MENKYIISEEEKNRILNLHESASKNQYLTLEHLGTPDMDSIDRMKKKYPNGIEIPTTITASGSNTFANGVDTINKNDPKVKEILQTISDLLKTSKGKVNVVVNGGASKVGSSSGYDNKALATRRRDNLIKLIKGNWTNPKLVVTPGSVKVGQSTTKDSDAARKEQYVSASISGEGKMNIPIKGEKGDNTNVYIPPIYKDVDLDVIPKKGKKKKICITIPVSTYKSFNTHVARFLKENGLSKIPWSETDV
jgi:hypothetical protein